MGDTVQTGSPDAACAKAENVRTGTSPEAFKQAILDNLSAIQGRSPDIATRNDWYMALAYTVRDRLMDRWCTTVHLQQDKNFRMVSYLSAEYLLGPHLGNCLVNLGMQEQVQEVKKSLARLGFDEILVSTQAEWACITARRAE